MVAELCETCRYWDPPDPPEGAPALSLPWAGSCHRHAPSPSAQEVYFPNTQADDWCGEWAEGAP